MNPQAGAGVTAPAQQLWVMGFSQKTSTFSSPTLVVDDTGQPTNVRPGWGAFFPDGKSVVFQHQSVVGSDGEGAALYTRKGELSRSAGPAPPTPRTSRCSTSSTASRRGHGVRAPAARAHQPDLHGGRRVGGRHPAGPLERREPQLRAHRQPAPGGRVRMGRLHEPARSPRDSCRAQLGDRPQPD